MAIGFTNTLVTKDGVTLPFYRYEAEDEMFRKRPLEAFELRTNALNSRLIFDNMVAVEGCLDGIGMLICFPGTRAIDFQRGLGQLFLDSRPAGAGLHPCPVDEGMGLTLTVFGSHMPEGPDGYAVPSILAAAWSYELRQTGLVGRRIVEGHLPAFPVI